ncbi:unnamed protein product [Caenorhabditis brenneri]
MNLLILISLIIIGVSSQIESNHGCKTNCNCPDFNGYITSDSDGYNYTKIDGCSFQMECTDRPQLQLLWEGTEFSRPSDAGTDFFFTTFSRDGESLPPIDMFSLFGIICEDGVWFATKYQTTRYFARGGEIGQIPSEEINGKKAKINLALC